MVSILHKCAFYFPHLSAKICRLSSRSILIKSQWEVSTHENHPPLGLWPLRSGNTRLHSCMQTSSATTMVAHVQQLRPGSRWFQRQDVPKACIATGVCRAQPMRISTPNQQPNSKQATCRGASPSTWWRSRELFIIMDSMAGNLCCSTSCGDWWFGVLLTLTLLKTNHQYHNCWHPFLIQH